MVDVQGSAVSGYEGVWREPAEESADLYPGLVVNDGRQAGSITIGQSRVALWAVIHTATHEGWDQVEYEYGPLGVALGFGADALSVFLFDLINVRGEFARLLLVLAAAERWERETHEQASYDHAEGDEWEAPAWWKDKETREAVRAQLQRCLECLG